MIPALAVAGLVGFNDGDGHIGHVMAVVVGLHYPGADHRFQGIVGIGQSRPLRSRQASRWIAKYTGKNIVKGYRRLWIKHYRSRDPVHDIAASTALLFLVAETMGHRTDDMPDDWPQVSSDRDDDYLFAAEAGKSEYIVTCDRSHLLRLNEFKGIPIGTPDSLFQRLKAAHPLSGA